MASSTPVVGFSPSVSSRSAARLLKVYVRRSKHPVPTILSVPSTVYGNSGVLLASFEACPFVVLATTSRPTSYVVTNGTTNVELPPLAPSSPRPANQPSAAPSVDLVLSSTPGANPNVASAPRRKRLLVCSIGSLLPFFNVDSVLKHNDIVPLGFHPEVGLDESSYLALQALSAPRELPSAEVVLFSKKV
ncbi:hypothetical protein Scep_018892 [Stephania cephalantha]|uniref:Uncharacterized protein n=1 Tax=Stephania cephalantha TaxID=152367 RepID=A0AAP0I9V0_9MAGN